MCRGPTTTSKSAPNSATTTPPKSNPSLISISLSSYYTPPSFVSCAVTACAVIGFLASCEMALNKVFEDNQHVHPLLEIELNRQILARHLGVDVLACFICATFGYWGRHICMDLFSSIFSGYKPINPAAYDKRLFTYHPESYRLSLFFFAYQVKNLYDTIKFNDGPEFVFHHVFSMITAMSVLDMKTGGVCNYYSIFYFGLSEVSTAVLCVLANFDDIHGVPGLADALPGTKVAVGAIFIVLFILCRTIMWPIASYRFVYDAKLALETKQNRSMSKNYWTMFLVISCSLLSILQAVWLIQIMIIGKEEIGNFLAAAN